MQKLGLPAQPDLFAKGFPLLRYNLRACLAAATAPIELVHSLSDSQRSGDAWLAYFLTTRSVGTLKSLVDAPPKSQIDWRKGEACAAITWNKRPSVPAPIYTRSLGRWRRRATGEEE